jgi:Flp pilus assembly protein TadG
MTSYQRTSIATRGEGGAALVELAVALPILASLFLGVVTGGAAYARKVSMTNAVREGTRSGATLEFSGSWAATTATRVEQVAAGDLGSAEICVLLLRAPSTVVAASADPCGLGGEPSTPAGVAPNTCLVKVWAQRTSKLQAAFFSRTVTQTAGAGARYERSC